MKFLEKVSEEYLKELPKKLPGRILEKLSEEFQKGLLTLVSERTTERLPEVFFRRSPNVIDGLYMGIG